jgi:hypothetical protein
MDHKQYYSKAMECLDLACSFSGPAERLQLLTLAQQFRRLANQVAAAHHWKAPHQRSEENSQGADAV